MHVLVTGRFGYIGSLTLLAFLQKQHRVTVVDNLVNSDATVLTKINQISGREIDFYLIDLTAGDSGDKLTALFRHYQSAGCPVDTVIHLAAFKSVSQSLSLPLEYYCNNLMSTTVLLNVMNQMGCRRFIFSSSAAVYGDIGGLPIVEDACVGAVTSPYGFTKYAAERLLMDIAAADSGWTMVALRYFNPVGGEASGLLGDDGLDSLVARINQVNSGQIKHLAIFGGDYPTADGTACRDYLHVMDVADGHLAALDSLSHKRGFNAYNLGTGHGYTVLEIVKNFDLVNSCHIPYQVVPRRPGDVRVSFSDVTKLFRELGWRAKRGLTDMLRDSWRHWQLRVSSGV